MAALSLALVVVIVSEATKGDATPAEGGPRGEDPADEWPLEPTSRLSGVFDVCKLFAAGATGGALTLFGLGVLVLPQSTRGATVSLRTERETQRRCMELGVTPEELVELDRRASDETK